MPESTGQSAERTRQVTARVPESVADEMKQVADKLGKTQSAVWATAAQHFLNAMKNPAQGPQSVSAPQGRPPARGLKPVLRYRP